MDSDIYVLLAGASVYEEPQLEDLPAVREDLFLMEEALTLGLRVPEGHIRILGEDGRVTRGALAMAMADFGRRLREGDTFLFYFSGHGREGELVLSDGPFLLASVMSYLTGLGARSKVAILDCCYAGAARVGKKDVALVRSLASLSGSGAAVLASCGAAQRSWLTMEGKASLYTSLLTGAMSSRRGIREGRISLTTISEEVRYQMGLWNESHPEKAQTPIYRESLYGTIFFQVEKGKPAPSKGILYAGEDLSVHRLKPMSTPSQKRLSVLVSVRKPWKSYSVKELSRMARDVFKRFSLAEVSENASLSRIHRGRAADAMWCYFGQDEEDIERGNFFAYTIVAPSEEKRALYFRKSPYAQVVDSVYVFENASYEMVKEIQKSSVPPEEIQEQYRHLCNLLIERAEKFLEELREAENETISFEEVKEGNRKWIREVKTLYLRLSDAEVLPASLLGWGEAVLEVAGWVVDLALALEHTERYRSAQEKWFLKSTTDRYEVSLDKLGRMEREEEKASLEESREDPAEDSTEDFGKEAREEGREAERAGKTARRKKKEGRQEIVPVRSEWEDLLEELRSLREKVLELTALRDDLLYHICPALQAAYEEKIAPLERELFAAQLYLKEKQRTIEILQAQINRRKRASVHQAQEEAAREYERYQEELRRKARKAQEERERWRRESRWSRYDSEEKREQERRRQEEQKQEERRKEHSQGPEEGPDQEEKSREEQSAQNAGSSQNASDSSWEDSSRQQDFSGQEEEKRGSGEGQEERKESEEDKEERVSPGQRLKHLYRKVVKRLHPDTRPEGTSPREQELWNRAVRAYQAGDLEEMEAIWEELSGMDGSPEDYEDNEEGREKLRKEIRKLRERIRALEEEIQKIQSGYPYLYKEQLEDEEALREKQENLREQIRKVREADAKLAEYIEKLKKQMGESG